MFVATFLFEGTVTFIGMSYSCMAHKCFRNADLNGRQHTTIITVYLTQISVDLYILYGDIATVLMLQVQLVKLEIISYNRGPNWAPRRPDASYWDWTERRKLIMSIIITVLLEY